MEMDEENTEEATYSVAVVLIDDNENITVESLSKKEATAVMEDLFVQLTSATDYIKMKVETNESYIMRIVSKENVYSVDLDEE